MFKSVEDWCFYSARPVRPALMESNREIIPRLWYLATDVEEHACMIAFVNRIFATPLDLSVRVFTDDCHACVTTPLTELWVTEPVAWAQTVLRVMRDPMVFRTVRAIAASLVLRDGLGAHQEAADTLALLYADQLEKTHGVDMCIVYLNQRGIDRAGDIDIASRRAWYENPPPVTWNRLAHIRAPWSPTRDMMRVLADQLFGTQLLAFERLETGGVLAVAHSAMLEEMLELVPLQWLRDSRCS